MLNIDINLPIEMKNQAQTDLENFIFKKDQKIIEQWKSVAHDQLISLDADTFKGLCKSFTLT